MKSNTTADKAEAFKQPQQILNQLQSPLHTWKSHLTSILSKKFVLRDFFCLLKLYCKWAGTQSKLESTGVVPWNEKKGRNGQLLQNILWSE